ncbi:MAG: tetratricopeptide repeat protein [Pseudanabaenaceae cyanobacterium SKYGB_i_bin29]|nr:tetratricopeptide repeat protein [Pseudanabaenaceae cyanobacterium SKYG29]MDW8420819.1 tetratricopeptide repeat protein [Pseudanabaenaceae cyanobacterium SKYGB_i_bin29]
MAQRTARQWIIAIFSVLISLSFLGVSVVPLVISILSPPAPKPAPQETTLSPEEKIKVEIASYEKVLAKEPTNQFALENIVQLKTQIGDIKGTIPYLQTLANTYPEQTVYRLTLARTYQQLQETDKAITEYRNVLAIEPSNLNALQQLVETELSLNRVDSAIDLLQAAIEKSEAANKIKPNSADVASVKLFLGDTYLQLKRFDEAEATYRSVKESDPKDFRPILGEAFIKRELQQEEEAQKLFAKAKEMAPEQFHSRIDELAKPDK